MTFFRNDSARAHTAIAHMSPAGDEFHVTNVSTNEY